MPIDLWKIYLFKPSEGRAVLFKEKYFLPEKELKKIEKITAGEAMKYAVTGGVVDLDAERYHETKKLDG